MAGIKRKAPGVGKTPYSDRSQTLLKTNIQKYNKLLVNALYWNFAQYTN